MDLKACVFFCFLFRSTFGVDIDVDYYYSSGLRSGTMSLSCDSHLSKLYCQIKCNMKPASCIQDECYECLNSVSANNKGSAIQSMPLRNIKLKHENINEESVDFEKLKQPEALPPIDLESFYALRPTVRHHIAHFCPNLDVARTCIRKCMAKGKPAFCGKDHVCYCGHKYTHTGVDDGGNAKEIYAQFKDMYKKYFGPGYNKGNVEV